MLRSGLLFSAVATALGELYCLSQDDFKIEGASWDGDGWTMKGSGGVHGKQTFNVLGGYVEFDYDTTGAHTGVNNNFYLVSPEPSYFKATNDCDIQGQGKPACMEMDIIEMNGDCEAQTTWHTWANHNGDCDQGGCFGQMARHGKSHIKAEFSTEGNMTVSIDGKNVDVTNPVPSDKAVRYVAATMKRVGAQIQSTQWVGWVPAGKCGATGDLDSSTFSVKNVRVSGSVVQGTAPSKCPSGKPAELAMLTIV